MKKNIFLIGCMLLMLVSCQTSVLDPLEGIFTPPTVAESFTSASCNAYKADGKRYFELNLGGSVSLQATLVGDSYYLTSNAYTEAQEAAAKKGNFVLGKTSVNGTQVETGTITVTQDGEAYKVKAILFVTGGAAYKLSWSGNFHFEPDPEPVVLTKLLVAQANANSTVTFKVGTDDMSLDMMGSPMGEGYALTADVYSADGVLHEGVYTAAPSSDNVGPGQFAPGYEYDLSEWGLGIMHWGTCWWVGQSVTHITSGTVTVEKKGTKFVITWGSEETYPNWATFTGEIPELTPSDLPVPDYNISIETGDVTDASWAVVPGVKSHTVKLTGRTTDEVKGQFVLILADGVDEIAGSYSCMEYAAEPYKMGNGYDLSAFGWGVGGSLYYQDGNIVLIEPGETLEVVKYAEGLYGFIGSTGYNFTAATDAYNGGGEFDGTVLTQLLGTADYTAYGINLAGIDLGTDGITVTSGDWGKIYGGDGHYLKLEFYSTDGKLAAGEYKACAEGGNVGEGEFGIGYAGMWGDSGTTWFTMYAGAAKGNFVTDGTLKVSVSGDIYTITLTSSVINAQYIGKVYE